MDDYKKELCKRSNVRLIQIIEDCYRTLEHCIEDDYICFKMEYSKQGEILIHIVTHILKSIGHSISEIDLELFKKNAWDYSKGKIEVEKSLAGAYPELAKEWNATLNDKINPEGILCGSNRIIYWQCSKCEHGANGEYFVSCYTSSHRKKTKRGFKTKKAAMEWEKEFILSDSRDPSMTFKSFVETYRQDMLHKIREHTWQTKNAIIDFVLLPCFGKMKLSSIKAADVLKWQNKMLGYCSDKGKPYSPAYLRSIDSQLSAIFNHAVKYYGLKCNPVVKAGTMGKKDAREMEFWTKEEYRKFIESVMDKPMSFYAFEMLYWCGLRLGELLALTPKDFDFTHKTVRINKSYQRIKQKDVITDPKTPKSTRTIVMPDFLAEEMKECISSLYGIEDNDRIFHISKHYLHNEMDRGSKAAGVKRIRIHDLRHSHVSMLINQGFSAVDIAERLGHESIDVTYRYAHMFPTTQTEIANRLDKERNEDNE